MNTDNFNNKYNENKYNEELYQPESETMPADPCSERIPAGGPEIFPNKESLKASGNIHQRRLPFWLGILVGVTAMSVVIIALAVIFGRGSITINRPSGDSAYETKIDTLISYLKKYHLKEIDDATIEEALADGLMGNIGDKYAVYYTSEEYSEMKENVSGEYAGIGISIIMNEDDKVQVYKVFKNSPAQEAGIFVNDLILEAAGQTDFPTLEDLAAVVRGTPGTTVDLVIERNGQELNLIVERRNITIETVSYEMLEDNIGYIMVEEFYRVAVGQFNEAIDSLIEEGMTALIIDLRDNPGGDYDTVVAMSDRILPEGPIITVKDRAGTIRTENSDQETRLDLPMVVLVNGNSASASEVFAGALQSHGVATIVGEQTFGKGVVQSIISLYDGSGMKFTTQEYYTPSGDNIDGVGITPDVAVSLPDDVYDDGLLTREEDAQLQAGIRELKKK
ncbi:MAG: S41 family peptidase [Lachnospiraceae bacterium]